MNGINATGLQVDATQPPIIIPSTSPHPPHRHYSASSKPSSPQGQQESNQKKLRREEVPRSSLPSTLVKMLI